MDADVADEEVLADRLRSAGAPKCIVGVASLVAHVGEAGADLLVRADARLYERRSRRQHRHTASDS